MSSLTFRNFEDQLDPEMLDQGRAFFESGGLKKITFTDGLFAAAAFEFKGAHHEIGAELNGTRIETVECSCDDFHEDWAEEPCVHVAALLYALKAGPKAKIGGKHGDRRQPASPAAPQEQPAKAKGKKTSEKKPVKPKDAAEALLGELDPREIYEFVRQMVLKNKDFKSQFLLHFSEKTAGDAQQFEHIVTNAIAAVRGRRKRLKGADGAKIAAQLSPLYKQAANAEAKGFFRQALAICRSFLQFLPPVFASMETPSAKLDTLMVNTFEVISLIVRNAATPFELRNEVFDLLAKEYEALEKKYAGEIKDKAYESLIEAGRATKRLNDVAGLLQTIIQYYQSLGKLPFWSDKYYSQLAATERLIHLYEKEMKDDAKVLATLEQNKSHIRFYLRLINKKIETGELATAEHYVKDLQSNRKQYDDQSSRWELERVLGALSLSIHQKSGDNTKIAKQAAQMFKDSNYTLFEFYDLEKKHAPPEKWSARVAYYLKETAVKNHRLLVESAPYLNILVREGLTEQLRDALVRSLSPTTWVAYGEHFKTAYPAEYLRGALQVIEHDLKNNYYPEYMMIGIMLQEMNTTESSEHFMPLAIKALRGKYSAKRNLIKILNELQDA